MNAHTPGRGEDLVAGGRAIGIGAQWLARLWSGGIDRILGRIDRGLEKGSVQATFPDGTTRILGGRAAGFGAVVEIRSWRALLRLATAGSVGWYQAWEAGEWESPDPVPLFALFMDNAVSMGDAARAHGPWRLVSRFVHWLHRNTRSGSLSNIHAHYDLGNDFYAQWLGETMIYSSALYSAVGRDGPNALSQFVTELDAAQSAKVGAMVERLDLEAGKRVLEIGCGWGTLAAFMAEHERVHVDALSLSDEQLDFARTRWSVNHGSVDFRKEDYRDVSGTYDAVVSVEMVEAVGRQFWP
ncbi:MAG: class I SAM-dependent methyltransferase, partial [Novosphingobium sp.]